AGRCRAVSPPPPPPPKHPPPPRRAPQRAAGPPPPRRGAPIPPPLAMIAHQAQHIKVEEPGGVQSLNTAQNRPPQTEPQIGDQHLGRQIAADLAMALGDLGAFACIGDETAPRLRPVV